MLVGVPRTVVVVVVVCGVCVIGEGGRRSILCSLSVVASVIMLMIKDKKNK